MGSAVGSAVGAVDFVGLKEGASLKTLECAVVGVCDGAVVVANATTGC